MEQSPATILSIILPLVLAIAGLFAWTRAIYERADNKREKLVDQVEGLTMENVTLKAENAELKRMNSEWRDLANKYHALAVKWYNLTQSMMKGGDKLATGEIPVAPFPSPDDAFNDKALPEEILG